MKSKKVANLEEVYKDINSIEIEMTDSFKSSLEKFYDVMRKHGIKQGEWTERGSRTCCTPEWNFCFTLFKQNKLSSLDLWLALNEPPEDLLAYGDKPKVVNHV